MVGLSVGATTGLVLSTVGAMLVPDDLHRSTVLFAIAFFIAGTFDLLLVGSSLGRDRETVSRRTGWVNWSVKNSAEMATILGTRPGMMSVYLLVVTLMLGAGAVGAAIAGAVYGATRGSGHLLLKASVELDRGLSVLGRKRRMRRLLGAVLLLCALGTTFVAA